MCRGAMGTHENKPCESSVDFRSNEQSKGAGVDEDEDEAGQSEDRGGHHDDFRAKSVGHPTVDPSHVIGRPCESQKW